MLNGVKMLECSHFSTTTAIKPIVTLVYDTPIDPTLYMQLVGSLQYLTFTRPHIEHVNKACQHFQAPIEAYMRVVKHILRYLKGTMDYGIRFLNQSHLCVIRYCDANRVACTNTIGRSTYSFFIFLGANFVSWSPKQQPTISRSSEEVEYQSLGQV